MLIEVGEVVEGVADQGDGEASEVDVAEAVEEGSRGVFVGLGKGTERQFENGTSFCAIHSGFEEALMHSMWIIGVCG